MGFKDFKNKIQNKLKNNTFFKRFFGFESGIDIADDNKVLYRKNVVIKNIIFVSNLIYTIIFAIVLIGEPKNVSNWLLTILLFPLTFFVNFLLKKMISKGPDDKLSQTLAMYIASFYMFLSALVIYFKLKYGETTYLQECGYILIYYSLAVCAFYQDKKMLKNVFATVLILITIIHFIVTYPILAEANGTTDILAFLKAFFTGVEFRDIIIRTLLLVVFMLVLYIHTSLGNYLQEERKKEVLKRREVMDEYTSITTKVFNETLPDKILTPDEVSQNEILVKMTNRLCDALSIDDEEKTKIKDFALVSVNNKLNIDVSKIDDLEKKYELIKEQSEIGAKLIKRNMLDLKKDKIIRAALEDSADDEFIREERMVQNDNESQIVLICDLYITMRSFTSYKKAYSHKSTISFMEIKFKLYFDAVLFDRFIRFSDDFEKIFDDGNKEE